MQPIDLKETVRDELPDVSRKDLKNHKKAQLRLRKPKAAQEQMYSANSTAPGANIR